MPCPGVPLLIGSQLDLHYQSLLPTDHVPERVELTGLHLNDDNFPPLETNPPKKEKKKENRIKKTEPGSKHTQTMYSDERQEFQHADNRTPPTKQKFNVFPNCQKNVESLKSHFQT